MSCAAARILASGPLAGRYLPALGRLRVVRSPSSAHSGPLRALQGGAGTLGYPLKRLTARVWTGRELRAARGATGRALGLVSSQPLPAPAIEDGPPAVVEALLGGDRSCRGGSMSCAAARILASGPLAGRYLPALGRLRVVRSPSSAHSGPLRALQAGAGTLGYPLKHPSTPVPSGADLRVGSDDRTRINAGRALRRRLPSPPVRSTETRPSSVSERQRCPGGGRRSGHGEQVAIAGSKLRARVGAYSGAASYPQCPQDDVPLPRTPTPFTATGCQTNRDYPSYLEPTLTCRLLQVQCSLSKRSQTSAITCPRKRDTSTTTAKR